MRACVMEGTQKAVSRDLIPAKANSLPVRIKKKKLFWKSKLSVGAHFGNKYFKSLI